MIDVWGQRLRALGVLVLLVLLVAGVPYLLLTLVGNPFPSSLPSIDEIRILLTQNGEGFANFLIRAMAILLWIAWLQLMLALVVEVVATARRSESRRLPIAPGIQSFAARLIAALTLATTLAAAPLMTSAVGALDLRNETVATAPTATLQVNVALDHEAEPASLAPDAGSASLVDASYLAGSDTASEIAHLQVDDSTELWDLAESAYGDGVMWKTIAAANAGQLDANGDRIDEDTEVVAPGTQLVLPGSIDVAAIEGYGTADSGNVEEEAPALDVEVRPGDSMWSLAEAEVERRLDGPASEAEVATYWSDVVAANQDVASGNVDLIYPGETLNLPGAVVGQVVPNGDAIAQATGAEDGLLEGLQPPDPVPPHTAADLSDSGRQSTAADLSDSGRQSTAGPAGVDRGSVEAASPGEANAPGLAGDLDSEDGAAEEALAVPTTAPPARERTVSATPKPIPAQWAVDPAAVGLGSLGAMLLGLGTIGALRRRRDLQRRTRPERALARKPSDEAAAFEAAMRHASDQLRQSRHDGGWRALPASAVEAMRQAGPLHFEAEESGRLHAVAVTGPTADPDIKTVELTRDVDPGQLLDELALKKADDAEVPGAAVVPTSLIVGTHLDTGDAVVLDLASAVRVELVGNSAAVRRFARTAVLDLAVSERADDLQLIAVSVGEELEGLERVHSVATFAEARDVAVRSGHTSDSLTPVVVIAALAPPSGDPDAAALAALGVVIVAPGVESETQIILDGEQAELRPAGTTVQVVALDDEHFRSVAELIDVTDPRSVEHVDDSTQAEAVNGVVATEECPVAAGSVDVKVLGPVEIAGAKPFSSLKAVDVIAYLAFNRNGVDADQIKSWVWPPFDPPTDKALANVMSRARTALGADETGQPFLSRAGADKTYRLSTAVTTDFDRFRALVALADQDDEPQNQLNLLKGALKLIRGVPFSGGAASSFAWADNHVRAQVEFTIDETVHRCADLALQLDDVATARWAALKGLELVPGCEQCFRRRFLVASADNNRSELRRAMADLERSASVDLGEPEAVDMISGDLLELYHQLDHDLVGKPA